VAGNVGFPNGGHTTSIKVHEMRELIQAGVTGPVPDNVAVHRKMMPVFYKAGNYLGGIGDAVADPNLPQDTEAA